MRRPRGPRCALGAAVWLTACMPVSPSSGPAPTGAGTATERSHAGGELVPPGYGSLRQDEIAMNLVAGPVRVQVTPLAPSLIRLTAPDTWERLAALRTRLGADADEGSWLLVSVQTEAPGGADFDPMDVEILAQGVLHRAERIVALTAGWGSGRLRQRATEQALYRFPATVDPWRDLEVQVGDVRYTAWPDRLPALEAERARARARAGSSLTRPDRTS